MSGLSKQYEGLDNWGKVEFLTQLEFNNNVEKWNLLTRIINDQEDYDLARIEALKILEIASIPKKNKDLIADSICNLIKNEVDYDVKNYAGVASANFFEYSCIQEVCQEKLLDNKEDIDLRYNYLDTLLKIPDKDKVRKVLEKLKEDSDLAKTARRNLKLLEG